MQLLEGIQRARIQGFKDFGRHSVAQGHSGVHCGAPKNSGDQEIHSGGREGCSGCSWGYNRRKGLKEF
jgi:hypothetical protein